MRAHRSTTSVHQYKYVSDQSLLLTLYASVCDGAQGFFGKWSRRYFLIQENKLSWFARSVDTEAIGSIALNESVIMRDTEISKKFSFTVEGSTLQGQKLVLRLQAFSAEQKKAWIDEIKAITKNDPFPYTF